MIEIEEFHRNFIQDVLSTANSSSLGYNISFFETVAQELVETGELPDNYQYAYFQYSEPRFKMEVSGYAYDDERQILYVLASQFFQNEDSIETITTKLADQHFKRANNFVKKSFEKYYSELEETSEAFEMSQYIYNKYFNNEISKVKIILFSDGHISRSYKGSTLKEISSIPVDTMVVDIEYLYLNFTAQNADSSFKIDIKLPVLKVPADSDKYQSYLAYISGNQVYDIYDTYGKRLLEQNVRTFLQFKGNVNKGIRNTLKDAPDMFFAYNNGITATASAVEMNSRGEITTIHNLQIVNGGQTTSAIYAARKTHKVDISKVAVQMKLSVITDSEGHADFVSRVAEYANTQNKVNKSDFFSNSPFHKEYKLYSTRTWVPSLTQERYKWFYERVRGEYMNEQAYFTSSKKKKFEIMYPRKNKIEKTFLAKSEVAWMQYPHIVSQGAQKSFLKFAEYITYKIEQDNLSITESYYKDSVSRIILFKTLEKIISSSDWFNGGFRANVVAYSISYLSFAASKQKKHFDFNKIWEEQSIPSDLYKQLELLTEQIFNIIINPPSGHGNPAQWSKKEHCWEKIKDEKIDLTIPKSYLLNNQEKQIIKKDEKTIKKIDKSIEIQSFVVSTPYENWLQIYDYFSQGSNRNSIPYVAFSILERYIQGALTLPSEKQSVLLYEAHQKAISEGLLLTL